MESILFVGRGSRRLFCCLLLIIAVTLGGVLAQGEEYSDSRNSSLVEYSVGKLISDYVRDKGWYSVLFRKDPNAGVGVSAHGVSLEMKPLRLIGGNTSLEASLTPYYLDADQIEYRGVFAGKGSVKYRVEDSRLKEDISFNEETLLQDMSHLNMSIEYSISIPENVVLSLDGKTPWDGKTGESSGDIYVIRKKTPGRIYLVNRFYTIFKPFITDSNGDKMDLKYTLSARGNETRISLNLPGGWLQEAQYPITIDPSIGIEEDGGWYRFINTKNCSTAASDCHLIDPTPAGSYVMFQIDGECSDYGDAQKDLFEFYLEDIDSDYDEDLYYALLHFDGDCTDMDELPNSNSLWISQVDPYDDSSPECSDDPFGDVREDVFELYGEGTSYECVDGEQDFYVTDMMQEALNDNDKYLAFKLDMDPPNQWDDDPGASNTARYNIYKDDRLYIDYQFTCVNSNDCPSDEYCRDLSTDLCVADLSDGGNCEDKATDDDDYACVNGVCEFDGFDSDGGYYCSDGTKCVNDYELFTYGTWHCEGSSYTKQCSSNGDWGSQTNCSWGCDEGTGCATTTSTTTTSTTIPQPNIVIDPTMLVYRGYV